jgi:hypothetical protein
MGGGDMLMVTQPSVNVDGNPPFASMLLVTHPSVNVDGNQPSVNVNGTSLRVNVYGNSLRVMLMVTQPFASMLMVIQPSRQCCLKTRPCPQGNVSGNIPCEERCQQRLRRNVDKMAECALVHSALTPWPCPARAGQGNANVSG